MQTGKVLDLIDERMENTGVPDKKGFRTLLHAFTQLLMRLHDFLLYLHIRQRVWSLDLSVLIDPSAKTKLRQILEGRIKCKR